MFNPVDLKLIIPTVLNEDEANWLMELETNPK
jgi:hypothetical protein